MNRVPPHDLEAETWVIGSCLIDRDAIDDALENVQPDDFYDERHMTIMKGIAHLHKKNKHIDTLTLRRLLDSHGKLEDAGGIEYISELMDKVPTSAATVSSARIVRSTARIRSGIGVCMDWLEKGYQSEDPDEYLSGLALAADQIAEERVRSSIRPISETLTGTIKELQEQAAKGYAVTGVPTGIAYLDRITAGLQPGDLNVIAGRPSSGKTSLALNIAENAARRGFRPLIFSLEMSANQLNKRLLAAGADVPGWKMRHPGKLEREDWEALADASRDVSELEILIDDSAEATLHEIRARSRRLARKKKLGIIIIDYLQIIREVIGRGKRQESRERVIAEWTRSLKALSKELGISILLLSQLNRGPEGRTDKRPIMADLRECISSDQLIQDSKTGARIAAFRWVNKSGDTLPSINGGLDILPVALGESWPTGEKKVFKLHLRSGREIRCTDNHPLLSIDGASMAWRPLRELKRGDPIATSKKLPEPTSPRNPFTEDELRLLGYLVCDGSYLKWRSVGYIKADLEMVNDINDIVWRRFGVKAKHKPCKGKAFQFEYRMDNTGPNRNPLIQWLKHIGIHGQKSERKELPEEVFECDNGRIAILLGAVWAGDGSVVNKKSGNCYLKFTSSSHRLIEQIQWMLMRLGIGWITSGPYRNTKSTLDLWEIRIHARRELEMFNSIVRMPGKKGKKLNKLLSLWPRNRDNDQLGRLPVSITNEVGRRAKVNGISWKKLGYRCNGKKISPIDLGRVSRRLGATDLLSMASSDLYWDEVLDIIPDGISECFDFRVPAHGAFVANGVIVHNSGAIEQDADLIMFVYREAMYKKDADDEAEIIVAKNRNGPTRTVYVHFNAELTRFEVREQEDSEEKTRAYYE